MNHEYHNSLLQDRRARQYAVVLYLPDHLDAMARGLREKYDPDYNIVDSHITIVFPFESDCPVDELASIIASVANDQEPFEVALDDLADFYPQAPIIYWSLQKNAPLQKLYYDLTIGLGLELPFSEYIPHVTLAREISNYRVMLVKENICAYLCREQFMAEAIDLITPLADNQWVSVRTFSLRG